MLSIRLANTGLEENGISKPGIGLIIIAGLIAAGLTSCFALRTNNSEPEAETGTSKGNVAPTFSIKTIDDKEINLEDYEEKIVIINFMTTECPYCKLQVESLKEINSSYEQNVKLISIGVHPQESENQLKKFKETVGAKWDFAQGPEIGGLYSIIGVPQTFIINREGIISFKESGAISTSKLSSEIEELL